MEQRTNRNLIAVGHCTCFNQLQINQADPYSVVNVELARHLPNVAKCRAGSIFTKCRALVHSVKTQVISSHGLVEKIGIKKDVIVSNNLLSMNFKLDRLTEFWGIFNEMVQQKKIWGKTGLLLLSRNCKK
ncbi:Pentatricopeptide repeat-containing protein [Abeliophyllum distichum]|uniref:Pentatricopeptide repeat-containing protein n=1 Tax=Abeliophyllum distichum TaxID=126358 RepID=A0ABD1RES9_9LAMI